MYLLFKYEELQNADFISGAKYLSGGGGWAKEPLSQLFKNPPFKGIGNQGGIRRSKVEFSKDDSDAYIVLLNTKKQEEWANYYDPKTGVLTYYGDNRIPGKDIHDTKQKGNLALSRIFNYAFSNSSTRIPPIFYFESIGTGSDVQFIGLAVPYVKGLNSSELLVDTLFESDGGSFRNYIAKFTILNNLNINREWLTDLKLNKQLESEHIPLEWYKFLIKGELENTSKEVLDVGYAPTQHTSQAVVKTRLTQRYFRQALLVKQKCCQLCGIDIPELLIASHIKPWNVSADNEKIDLNNGLLLCANHDKLFDRNLISFDSNGDLIISNKLYEYNYGNLNLHTNNSIIISEEREVYLNYHRNMLRK